VTRWAPSRRLYRTLGWLCLLVMTSVPLAELAAQTPLGSQNALAGARVFGSKGCANCHAINGVGQMVGPDLAQGRLGSYYGMAAGFWNHFGGMVEVMRRAGLKPQRMSAHQMEDLIAFFGSVDAFSPPGDADRGAAVFRGKHCSRCHQVRGQGGVVGPNLDALGSEGPLRVAAAMWNHGAAMMGTMARLGLERPTFSATELNDLLTFLRRESPRNRIGPVYLLPGNSDEGLRLMGEKKCLECHSVRGTGAGLAPDLASRSRAMTLYEFAATLWNKAPAMLGVMRARGVETPTLAASDMSDIVAYLYAVRYFRAEGDPAAGRRLLATRGCTSCHRAGREGVRQLGEISDLKTPASVIAAMWNHSILVFDDEARPSWPFITADEMADIVAVFIAQGSTR